MISYVEDVLWPNFQQLVLVSHCYSIVQLSNYFQI